MLVVEDRGAVRWVTLNRPDRMNAIPVDGWDELRAAFEDYGASRQRCLVIIGSGGNFCSGAELSLQDVDDLKDRGTAEALMRRPGAAAMALHLLFKPTIAAVDGSAAGAGMNLALGCDIVVASDRVRFAEAFVKRGLALDFGGSWLLPRAVGRAKANDIAMTGRPVDAAEALASGLVSRVVPADRLEEIVTTLADEVAAGPPDALRSIKRSLRTAAEVPFRDAVAAENEAQALHLVSDDFREGVEAFFQKRPPRFTSG